MEPTTSDHNVPTYTEFCNDLETEREKPSLGCLKRTAAIPQIHAKCAIQTWHKK